jgi:DeoR/GlpR family transcriptional regulator of sugar metabolism
MIMFSQERCQAILQLLAERQRLTTRDLEALYPASPATMRRDLAALESQGLLLRVHGGIASRLISNTPSPTSPHSRPPPRAASSSMAAQPACRSVCGCSPGPACWL